MYKITIAAAVFLAILLFIPLDSHTLEGCQGNSSKTIRLHLIKGETMNSAESCQMVDVNDSSKGTSITYKLFLF